MALKKNNEDLFVKRFSLFYYIHSQKPCSCLFVNMCIMEIASLTNRNVRSKVFNEHSEVLNECSVSRNEDFNQEK